MLTQKQKELLLFIHKRSQDQGVTPSFDEMRDALKLKSKSGIHRLITALEERGFIRRLPNRARAIEIVKFPENLLSHGSRPIAPLPSKRNVPLNVITGTKHAPQPSPPPQGLGVKSYLVPMMGRIAAGVPITAIQDHSQDILCPPHLIPHGDHFALEVKGDSMIEAGIFDGDTVIIRRCSTAENGEIVVALVEKEEATLKRVRKKGSTIALEAANPAFETRIFRPDQITIQGRLVGLLRKY